MIRQQFSRVTLAQQRQRHWELVKDADSQDFAPGGPIRPARDSSTW